MESLSNENQAPANGHVIGYLGKRTPRPSGLQVTIALSDNLIVASWEILRDGVR